METGPHNQSHIQETPSDDKKESKKSKKKDVEKLGAFAVEAKPDQKDKKSPNAWERLSSSDTPDKAEKKLAKNERSSNDKTPELNTEAPLEHLSEVELVAVAKDLARGRRDELAAELAEAAVDSPAADQAEAADAFLAYAEVSGDLEAAFASALQESDTASAGVGVSPEGEASEPSDAPVLIEQIIDPHQAAEGELSLWPHRNESAFQPDTDEPDLPASTSAGRPVTPMVGSGVGNWIPQPPISGGPGSSFNTVHSPGVAANPNVITVAAAYSNERQAQLRGLLVGGIVGYLIGRRRGRIKTEKRLVPVQKKLEKEVQGLQTMLLEKEGRVRQAAAERRQVALSPASERLFVTTVEQKRTPPVALRPSSERIGHVLMAGEGFASPRELAPFMRPMSEKRPAVNATPENMAAEKMSVEKHVSVMPRAELLAVSETIVVEGTSLRQIYETHLIGERGLRRLVAEHLGGGDMQWALKRELVEREIDFERDPVLRDRARACLNGGGKSALNTLVKQAGAMAVLEDQAEVADQQPVPAAKRNNATMYTTTRRAADIALISIITILLAFIIVLLTRGQ